MKVLLNYTVINYKVIPAFMFEIQVNYFQICLFMRIN
jgi:hypothetical protein